MNNLSLSTGRTGPWAKERAASWAAAQPWIRGCNYMPASCANRIDQWQALGCEERFAEMDRELAVAELIGFNTVRLILAEEGFGVWLADHDGMLARFERTLDVCAAHGIRAIVVLGNDCSRPQELWKMPAPGPQSYDLGYHGGRRLSQHGSFPNAVGYTCVDDPVLRPQFFAMCDELLSTYRNDERILFWNLWNEPGNNHRGPISAPHVRELFELAWRIDPKQPLAADVWTGDYGAPGDGNAAQRVAGECSDIVSYHSYGPLARQLDLAARLRSLYGRPLVNTEWLARTIGCEVFDCYPFFAQNRIGCTCWGFVAGKYQTYEPWEGMWKQIEAGGGRDFRMTKWLHDLLRPSLRPYDPKEVDVIRRVNAEADADGRGESPRAKIAKRHSILSEDIWYGFRRIKFDFQGLVAWIVEPSCAPLPGNPWTWTMQWAEAFVDRTGVPDLLRRGFHHVTIEAFDQRASDASLPVLAAYQRFLVEELGLAPKANLVGMSWGGFFSTRYAARYPQNVCRIYLDAPLLTFAGCSQLRIGPWAETPPDDGDWASDPRMPVNSAPAPIAAAGIPILLLYGGQDQTVPPAQHALPFIERFRAAGGCVRVVERGAFGHHPHGVDPDKTAAITDFFLTPQVQP